jgi:hypothetical protein
MHGVHEQSVRRLSSSEAQVLALPSCRFFFLPSEVLPPLHFAKEWRDKGDPEEGRQISEALERSRAVPAMLFLGSVREEGGIHGLRAEKGVDEGAVGGADAAELFEVGEEGGESGVVEWLPSSVSCEEDANQNSQETAGEDDVLPSNFSERSLASLRYRNGTVRNAAS